jgi:hypothetical protein
VNVLKVFITIVRVAAAEVILSLHENKQETGQFVYFLLIEIAVLNPALRRIFFYVYNLAVNVNSSMKDDMDRYSLFPLWLLFGAFISTSIINLLYYIITGESLI